MASLDGEFSKQTFKNVEEAENSLTKIKNFLIKQFLPIGIMFSIPLGIVVPQPAVYLNQKIPLVRICVTVAYTCIGLRLRLQEAKSAMKCFKEVLFGLVWVLFLAPVTGTIVLNQTHQFGPLLGEETLSNTSNSSIIKEKVHSNMSTEEISIPILGPEEFRLGLQIYCMSPSAIASSLIIVTAANGHRGLSLLVSVICTIVSVFTIPPILVWLIPTLQNIHINVGKVLLNTTLLTLLPLLIGRGCRFLGPVKKIMKKVDVIVKYTVITSIVTLCFVQVSRASASGSFQKLSVLNIVCMTALGTSLTTFHLLTNYGLLSLLPGFSQKSVVTLSILSAFPVPVMAVTIIDVLPDKVGDKGLLTLPSIFVYLSTLLMLNCFAVFVKVSDNDIESTKRTRQDVEDGPKSFDDRDKKMNSISNEAAVFTIYTDEMTISRI